MPGGKKRASESTALLSEQPTEIYIDPGLAASTSGLEPPPPLPPLLPLLGELLVLIDFFLYVFVVFLALKLAGAIDSWAWWMVFLPVWMLLALLLFLTQTKRFSKRASVVLRVTWLLTLMTTLVFIALLNFRLDFYEYISPIFTHLTISVLLAPLWVLVAGGVLLSIYALVLSCSHSSEARRHKYLLVGLALLSMCCVFGPFLALLQLRLTIMPTLDWATVFIPLWVVDGLSLCFAVILLLFTFGGSEGAIFTPGQVVCFIVVLPASVVFKVLLVIALQPNSTLPFFYTLIPLTVAQAMLFACGLDIRLRERDRFRSVQVAQAPGSP